MNSLDETIDKLKSDLEAVAGELDERNRQFESIKSGPAGWFVGKGLWLTGLTYGMAGIRLSENTVPLSFVTESPVWFWKALYLLTLLTALILWVYPSNRVIYTLHWMIPTISLMTTTLALLAGGILDVISGGSLSQQVLGDEGLIGGALFTGYILMAQYTFLRLSVLLKDGTQYRGRMR